MSNKLITAFLYQSHDFMSIPSAAGLGILVAQKVYVGQSTTFTPRSSVRFKQHGHAAVRLEKAKPGFASGGPTGTGMVDADERVSFDNNAPRITLRLEVSKLLCIFIT
jgi:hypothetical protein